MLCFKFVSCVRKVTFFDTFADKVDTELNAQTDESFVVIIASAKVNVYDGIIFSHLKRYSKIRKFSKFINVMIIFLCHAVYR